MLLVSFIFIVAFRTISYWFKQFSLRLIYPANFFNPFFLSPKVTVTGWHIRTRTIPIYNSYFYFVWIYVAFFGEFFRNCMAFVWFEQWVLSKWICWNMFSVIYYNRKSWGGLQEKSKYRSALLLCRGKNYIRLHSLNALNINILFLFFFNFFWVFISS